MKKLLGIMMVALVCLLGAACSHNGNPAKVAEKIAAGQALSEEDYTVMINYCGHFAEEAQKLQDEIDVLPASDPKAVEATDKIAELQASSRYLTPFFEKITTATRSEVGVSNVELINKYAGYEWFSAPDWATIVTDTEATGIVVDDSEASGAVIATPVGETVK